MDENKQIQNYNTSPNGTIIFVLGLVGLIFFQLLSIVAWVMGHNERKLYPDDGMVKAGWILGIIGTIWLILFLVIFVFIFLFIFVFAFGVSSLEQFSIISWLFR